MSESATLSIESLAAGGDGVARRDGLVVFVPRTVPGETVLATIEKRGRFARAEIEQILAPSPDRVEPPCEHYTRDACGGCQIQHVRYQAQLTAKSRIIADALARIGRRDVPLPFVRPSESEWRYRSKLTLTMRRKGVRWTAGLHRYDDPARIFALRDCPITQREVVKVWRDILDAEAHLPDASELRGSVRATGESGGYVFVLEGGRAWETHAELFDAVPVLTSLWWVDATGKGSELHSRGPALRAGATFAQVNPAVAAVLRDFVVARVLAREAGSVVDAYAGTGLVASRLAAAGKRVVAIELDEHAAREAARSAGVEAIAGAVEDHIERHLPAGVVILNPPRAGVHERVTAALERCSPKPAIVYVSCDPATLARDVARLPSFGIEAVTGFDMFPQTAHVETVCELAPLAEASLPIETELGAA